MSLIRLCLLMLLVLALAASLVHLALSPRREYAADRFAADLCGSPHGLADALLRLELAMELVGPYAMPAPEELDEGSNEPPIGPDWAETVAPVYFNWRKISIYGGSNEIQKNIIAKAILGL